MATKTNRKQQAQKYGVYALMFFLCVGCLWLIFAPAGKDAEAERRSGFNAEIPDPTDADIVGSKKVAYEEELARQKREEKMRTLEDYAFELSREQQDEPARPEEHTQPDPLRSLQRERRGGGGSYGSDAAYRSLNASLGSLYEQPQSDTEEEQLRGEVERLRGALAEQQSAAPGFNEQVALLEKSYELAAKYMPGNGKAEDRTAEAKGRNGKTPVAPVGRIERPVVSTLQPPLADTEVLAQLAQPRNRGFHTAVGEADASSRNTIRACIHEDQTIVDGQSIRLRLLEPMRAGNLVLPANTLLTGKGTIQGERLGISVTMLEYEGTLLPVELTVYDNDGQEGIYIPGSMETSAAKEVAANVGQNLGTSVSITNQTAGDQLLAELGKGAIQGASGYISKKMRTVKVHLKAGYTLLLYQKKD